MFDRINNSLFLKIVLPVLGVFIVGLVFVAIYVPYTIKENAIATAIESSETSAEQFKVIRGYYTVNVVKKVLEGSDIKPSYNHENQPGTIPLPATLIHDLSKELAGSEVQLKLYSPYPFPNRSERRLDDFQKKAWEALTQNPDEPFIQIISHDGHEAVRVAIADRMTAQACVDCHNTRPDTPKNDWRQGDVRGVLELVTHIDTHIAHGYETAWKIIGVLVTLMIMVMAVLIILFRNAGGKLRTLNELLRKASTGDLSVQTTIAGSDELAVLGQDCNKFMSSTRDVIKNINDSSSQLADASKQLLELSSHSQRRFQEQQNESAHVASAITEMSASIQEVERSANHAASATRDANQLAHQGREVVDASIVTINQLAEEVEGATEVIQQLEKDSENIGAVLDVIRSIAEQTNLLALNAAIEAARAGEQGRGFAVVADEVRTLASRTQKSTEEIQSMIKRLQDGSRNAVAAMERSRTRTHDTVEQAGKTGDVLTSIVDAISTITNLNSQIATVMEQQSAASETISNSASQINYTTEQSVDAVGNIASSSSQMATLAKNLQSLAKKFRC